MVRTGATGTDAAAEWLRWAEHERDCKPSTMDGYRGTADRIVRQLGHMRIEDVTTQDLERWKATLRCSNRTTQKYLVILHGIFRRAMRVWGLPTNPVANVERPRVRISTDVDAFSPEEVYALSRAASSCEDSVAFLTAAFTGLRLGELLALRWCDVDFAGEATRVRRSFTALRRPIPRLTPTNDHQQVTSASHTEDRTVSSSGRCTATRRRERCSATPASAATTRSSPPAPTAVKCCTCASGRGRPTPARHRPLRR